MIEVKSEDRDREMEGGREVLTDSQHTERDR